MIEKVINKANLREFSEIKENLSYWLSKKPEERVEAVEYLRRTMHGSSAKLQRTARVIQRSQNHEWNLYHECFITILEMMLAASSPRSAALLRWR